MNNTTEITKPIYNELKKLRKKRLEAERDLNLALNKITLLDVEIEMLKDKLAPHEIQRAWNEE